MGYAPNREERLWAFTPPTGDKPFDDWIAPQRSAAIGCIFKAVRKLPINEVDLATAIYRACIEVQIEVDPFEGSKAKDRLKKVKRVLKGIRKQIDFVGTDPYLSQRIKEASGIAPAAIIQLLFELQSLENQLSWLARRWRSKADLAPTLKDRRPSELEWLAGVSLPLVYERHFLSPAGRSRNSTGEPDGPCVRFVDATLKELGEQYSRESIVRAFSRLTALRDDHRASKDRPLSEGGQPAVP